VAGLGAFLSRELLPQPSSFWHHALLSGSAYRPASTVRNGIRSTVLGIDDAAEQGLPVAVVALGALGSGGRSGNRRGRTAACHHAPKPPHQTLADARLASDFDL